MPLKIERTWFPHFVFSFFFQMKLCLYYQDAFKYGHKFLFQGLCQNKSVISAVFLGCLTFPFIYLNQFCLHLTQHMLRWCRDFVRRLELCECDILENCWKWVAHIIAATLRTIALNLSKSVEFFFCCSCLWCLSCSVYVCEMVSMSHSDTLHFGLDRIGYNWNGMRIKLYRYLYGLWIP